MADVEAKSFAYLTFKDGTEESSPHIKFGLSCVSELFLVSVP